MFCHFARGITVKVQVTFERSEKNICQVLNNGDIEVSDFVQIGYNILFCAKNLNDQTRMEL